MPPFASRLVLSVSACTLLAVFIACGSSEDAAKELSKADAAWDGDRKAFAVSVYKSSYGNRWATKADKERILPRIVEHEAKAGNFGEAKSWVRRGLTDHLNVEYPSQASKEAADAARKEHAEDMAKVVEAERQRKEAAAADEAHTNPVTMVKYNRVATGMTHEEVAGALGTNGEELSRVELGGTLTYIVAWKNRNGSNMNVTFQNGRVVSKAQFGLK